MIVTVSPLAALTWLSLIHIYLKSSGSYTKAKESERDNLICDEYGFAETKDLPYGTYTCLLYTYYSVVVFRVAEKCSEKLCARTECRGCIYCEEYCNNNGLSLIHIWLSAAAEK